MQVSVRPEALHPVRHLLLDVLWGVLSPSTYRPSVWDPQIAHHLLLHWNWWVFKVTNLPFLVLVFVHIYYFIGIGQWSTSYYKTTFSYIRHVLVFVYLFNMFLINMFLINMFLFNMFSYMPFLSSNIERILGGIGHF